MSERYRRRAPTVGDSSRWGRREPSPSSSSVLPALHWPRDGSPYTDPHKLASTVEARSSRAPSHRPPSERTRRRSPSPPSRTRLDSPRTAHDTHSGDRRSHQIDDYDPPARRRRSHSPDPPPTSSRRRSSRSRSPRRSAPRDPRALDERDRDGDIERVERPAPLSGWEAAYDSIGRRRIPQKALESGTRRSRGGQAGRRDGRARYEDVDAPSWAGGAGTSGLGYDEGREMRRDGSRTERGSRFASAQDRSRPTSPHTQAANPLPRPPPHRTSRHLEHSHQRSFRGGLVGPSYIEFSPSPAPPDARTPSRSPVLSPALSRSPRAGTFASSPTDTSPHPPPPAPTSAHIVWLGPLPADLHPDEVVALLAPYGHASFRLHLAETGDGDDAYALEVSCATRDAARALVGDARAARVELRGCAVELLQEDVGVGLEEGEVDESDEGSGGGETAERREEIGAEGSVRSQEQVEFAAAGEQHEGRAYLSHETASPRSSRRCRTSSPDRLPLADLPNLPSHAHFQSTHLDSAKRHASSRSPSLSPSCTRTSRAPALGPLPSPSSSRARMTPPRPAPAQYRIHPTRLVSPYPRSPSPPGDAAWIASREAEIEREMDDEVREALRDRWEREGWETWIERWDKAEVVDLTQEDEGEPDETERERDEEAMDVDG
ncbi:hypothetical protein JCM3775_003160 [Rhodotorula graminis]